MGDQKYSPFGKHAMQSAIAAGTAVAGRAADATSWVTAYPNMTYWRDKTGQLYRSPLEHATRTDQSKFRDARRALRNLRRAGKNQAIARRFTRTGIKMKGRSGSTTKRKAALKRKSKGTKVPSKAFVAKVKKSLVHTGERKQVMLEDFILSHSATVTGASTPSQQFEMNNHLCHISEIGNQAASYPVQGTNEAQYIGADYYLEGIRWKYWIVTQPMFLQGYITRYIIRQSLGNPYTVTIGASQALTTFWEDLPVPPAFSYMTGSTSGLPQYEAHGRLRKGFTIVDKLMFSAPAEPNNVGTATIATNNANIPAGTDTTGVYSRNIYPVVQYLKFNHKVHAATTIEAGTAFIPREKKYKYFVVFIPHDPNGAVGNPVAKLLCGGAVTGDRGIIQQTTFFRDN